MVGDPVHCKAISDRLMDEFAMTSEIGRGTTVTMTKWRERR